MEKEFYSILEVANLLEITTQAVYKRLQQDKKELDPHVSTVNNKKSLSVEGVKLLATLMQLNDPFTKEVTNGEDNNSQQIKISNPEEIQEELLSYLKDDNERLKTEVQLLKNELAQTRALREQDKQNAIDERREYEEARKRTDTLLLKAMMAQEEAKKKKKPSLLAKLFGRDKEEDSENQSNN